MSGLDVGPERARWEQAVATYHAERRRLDAELATAARTLTAAIRDAPQGMPDDAAQMLVADVLAAHELN